MHASTFLASTIGLLAAHVAAQTPAGFSPSTSTLLPASYGNVTITPGLKLAQSAVQSAPTIAFPSPSSMVFLLDLDAPFGAANRSYSPILHYMAASSSGNTTAIAPYIPPQPPAGSPDHRYVLLAYMQSSDSPVPFVFPKSFEKILNGQEGRLLFDLEGFVKAAGLGDLMSANYFLVGSEAAGNATEPAAPGNGTQSQPQPYEGKAVRIEGMTLAGLVVVAIGMMALV